jgi:alpha-L-fucosidase
MKIRPMRLLSAGLFLVVFILSSCSARKTAKQKEWIDPLNETTEQRDARMAWWRDARFGLFIHWGVYSVPAGTYHGEKIPGIGEWIMHRAKIPVADYKSFAREFNPVKYDPKAWVKMAKDAGMKYIVITSKHHDGFALFDSKVTDWDVVDATPYGKDLLKPLVREAKKAGLKIGFYYSQAQDWNHPGGAKSGYKEGEYWDPAQGGSFDTYLKEIAYPQVREILTHYDIDILWWDTPVWMTKERADLLRPLLALKPGLITNNRLGGGYKGDTDTPEQHIPATGIEGRDWEVCMTMNDTWGYKSYDDNWKSTEDLLYKLIDIASKGGNFLLNVGPKPDGTIPQASIDRLAEVGEWMKVNGESIYGTSASPFRRPWWGRCTRKVLDNGNTRLYLQVFDWPEDHLLTVPVKNVSAGCFALADKNRTFSTTQGENGLTIDLQGEAPDKIASVIVLDIEGSPIVPDQNIIPDAEGALRLKPDESNLENRSYTSDDHARLIRGQERSYITWKSNRTWMEWPVEIPSATRFDVFVTLAASHPGNRIQIQAGEVKQEFELPDTREPDQFERVKVGNLEMPAGKSLVTVRVAGNNWREVNFGNIEMVPSAK